MERSAATAPARPRPATGEAPFELDEIFYSRTDPRGVIRAGNEVFRRVAAYDWDRLVGAQHKIIRHADMPRAVFHLLWRTIRQDRPIGAYVKNRAADGLHYWVFATVTPIAGGYLSVRFKPTSPVFATIRPLYAAVLAAEAGGMAPDAGAALLAERLAGLGFASYETFMTHAIAEELAARDTGLGRPADGVLAVMRRVDDELGGIAAEIAALLDDFSAIHLVPANMRIFASRLEPMGGPITAISENYRIMATEVLQRLNALSANGKPIAAAWQDLVHSAIFLHCAARVQEEAVQHGCAEDVPPAMFDADAEIAMLAQQMLSYREKARAALADAVAEVAKLPALCTELRQLVVGLDAVRRTCRVESSWLKGESGGLTAIIGQLDAFHVDTDARLNRISRHAVEIGAMVRSLDRRRATPDARLEGLIAGTVPAGRAGDRRGGRH